MAGTPHIPPELAEQMTPAVRAFVDSLLATIAAQEATIATQQETIAAQQATITRLEQRVVELERRLGMNSGNSSMAPSSDGPGQTPLQPTAMIPYLEEHLHEEDGHDELLLQDLESIGVPRAEVLRRLPEPCVAGAQGAMHYWTVHHHPVAMFGSLVPSECYQTSKAAIDYLHERSGYPRSAFRTIELHSELDQDHGAEALKVIDSLPLTDWHHEVLSIACLNFLAGTTQMYRELLEEFPVEE